MNPGFLLYPQMPGALLTPQRLESALNSWVRARAFKHVDWNCTPNEHPDPTDDLDAATLASIAFLPRDGGARVWLFLQTDGFVGIGIETRGKVAQRAGWRSSSPVYAAGRQSVLLDLPALLSILDIVADGDVEFAVWRTLFGISVQARRRSTGMLFEWDEMSISRTPSTARRVIPEPWR